MIGSNKRCQGKQKIPERVENQGEVLYLKDTHLIPLGNNLIHVRVADKEADNAIWNGSGKLNQHSAIVLDHMVIISEIKFGADSHLI